MSTTPKAVPEEVEVNKCAFCSKFLKEGTDGDVTIFEPLQPVVTGHMLVVPKTHVIDFTDDPRVTALVVKEAADYAKKNGGAYNLITSKGHDATQSVFHLHIHLVPRTANDGLLLPWSNQASTRQATIKEVVERLEREIPKDLELMPEEIMEAQGFNIQREKDWVRCTNQANAQHRAALKKIEEEM